MFLIILDALVGSVLLNWAPIFIKLLQSNMLIEELYSGAMIKLTATNYTLQRYWMEDLLNFKDFFVPLNVKGKNLDPTKKVEWKKLNRKTTDGIRQWIDHSLLHHVVQEPETYALQKKLEEPSQDGLE